MVAVFGLNLDWKSLQRRILLFSVQFPERALFDSRLNQGDCATSDILSPYSHIYWIMYCCHCTERLSYKTR